MDIPKCINNNKQSLLRLVLVCLSNTNGVMQLHALPVPSLLSLKWMCRRPTIGASDVSFDFRTVEDGLEDEEVKAAAHH